MVPGIVPRQAWGSYGDRLPIQLDRRESTFGHEPRKPDRRCTGIDRFRRHSRDPTEVGSDVVRRHRIRERSARAVPRPRHRATGGSEMASFGVLVSGANGSRERFCATVEIFAEPAVSASETSANENLSKKVRFSTWVRHPPPRRSRPSSRRVVVASDRGRRDARGSPRRSP